MAVKEAKDEGEPNFYIRLSEFKSLLHAGGLPLPGKTGFLLGSCGLLEKGSLIWAISWSRVTVCSCLATVF